eukprot:TRINITY_DN977_c0_g2_i2.p1 TRINITY_DN977_c0_g2~~TRINITY_DN977_c0_g2_i2.p1  ORF type:complete len:404 (-),score=60.51 TRINITY_DN977_c0_g2_i2:32-1204(-)
MAAEQTKTISGSVLGKESNSFSTPAIEAKELHIISKIGGGSFGNVFKGSCRGKRVAIKILHKQELEEKVLSQFLKEVEIMTHLRHPNIVLYMGACTEPGELAIVTELVPKGNLHDLLHNSAIEISLVLKLKMAKDIAQGMNWLHCSKPLVIHRDLKPTNLLVDNDWTIKVCDFGLSTACPNILKDDGTEPPGTPLWMSPEILKGKPLTEKADVYSYGLVLWEILTRQELFPHLDTFEDLCRAVCELQERPPIPNTIPKPLKDLMEQCWQEDQSKRCSFEEIIENLDDIAITCTISDPIAQEMWQRKWKGKNEVKWSRFLKVFCKALQLKRFQNSDLNYKCLRALLAQQKDNKYFVTLESFVLFVAWFGPISPSFIDRIKNISQNLSLIHI